MNLKAISFIILFILNLQNLLGQQKVLFRYNSDYDLESELQSRVILKNVSVAERIEEEEELARGVDGWNYLPRKTSYFFGDTSYIQSTNNIVSSFFETIGVSGDIWIKTFDSNGTLIEWDDNSKPTGLRLFLQEKKLYLQYRISGDLYQVQSSDSLELLRWYSINWVCKVTTDSVELSIYMNGELFTNSSFELPGSIGFITMNAIVNLGYSVQDSSTSNNFSGEIYAANLKNYIPDESYILSAVPFDGSAYMGLPTYHDYTIGSTEPQLDQRISNNSTPVINRAFVPYLNDDFIPQGITNSCEDEDFSGSDEMVYISLYNRTVDGQTRLKRSILVELNPHDNYKVRRVFRLQGSLGYSHVGGIAFKNGSIYVSSASSIEVYALPEYTDTVNDKYQDLYTLSSRLFSVNSVASFTTYYNDTIWVGDYCTPSQSNPYLYGYPLDSEGSVLTNFSPKVYRLPFQTQGLVWRNFQDQQYLFISVSGGDAGSKIHRCKKKDLSRYTEPIIEKTFNIPAGGEDLSFGKTGQLLNVSESGAKYFQKRENPWDSFYPFMFTIGENVLFSDIPISINNSKDFYTNNLTDSFMLQTFPNPFNNLLTIMFKIEKSSYIDARIYDVTGREIQTLTQKYFFKGIHRLSWSSIELPSGPYFLKLIVGKNRYPVKKILLVK